MTDKLKPCPFCGGEVKLQSDDYACQVICDNDDCLVAPFEDFGDNEEAIKAWNTRAIDKENQWLRKALDDMPEVILCFMREEDMLAWEEWKREVFTKNGDVKGVGDG